jgi:N-acetylglucosamine-6-phosphate deacetylase
METIKNVTLILPETLLPAGWISFENGRLEEIGSGTMARPELNALDGQGMFLAPGFIDLHVHGGNGEDFLTATPKGIVTATEFHLAGGTTSLCPTAATASYDTFEVVLERCHRARESARIRILGVHLEGPHLSKAKAGAQEASLMRPPTSADIDWLVARASKISQMTVAPELKLVPELIRECSRAGIIASAGHTEAGEAEMEEAVSAGLRKVTHLFNAMTSSSKKGLFREVGTSEFALTDPGLVCEVIGDSFHVVPRLLRLAYQAKSSKGIALVSDALAGAGLPFGTHFKLGRLGCKVGNGYALLEDDSALSGSLCRMIDLVKVMVEKAGLPLAEAVRMASLTPACILNQVASIGSLEIGKLADMVLFDDDFKIHKVWIAGKEVETWPQYRRDER